MHGEQCDTEKVLHNYTTSANVRARWKLYELAAHVVDIEQDAYFSLPPQAGSVLADVGSSDGQFLERTALEFGHDGLRIALDVQSSQFTDSTISNSLLRTQLAKIVNNKAFLNELDQSPYLQDKLFLPLAGDATALPLKDDSVDRLYELFMLYHVPTDKLHTALDEAMRVLKSAGHLVLATSGVDNKQVHRDIEAHIASTIGPNTLPPPRMNMSFTTELATQTLPEYAIKHGLHVYAGFQNTDMIIESFKDVELYLGSQRSMLDQYSPIPHTTAFEEALNQARYEIYHDIVTKGRFTDTIRRSMFIMSKHPVEIGKTALSFEQLC